MDHITLTWTKVSCLILLQILNISQYNFELNFEPPVGPRNSISSQFKQFRIYFFLDFLHNNLTSCRIVVIEKKIFPIYFNFYFGPLFLDSGLIWGSWFNSLESTFLEDACLVFSVILASS